MQDFPCKNIIFSKEYNLKSKKNSLVIWLLAVLAVSLVFMSCPSDSEDPPPDNRHTPYGEPPYTGAASGSASGVHEHGPCVVSITLTLAKGYITGVSFTGSSGNSAGLGERVLNLAPAKIKEKNSVEIDVVSGSSVTSNLLITAGRQALATIPGYIPD